jgi:5-methyltetrahydrofolate--homocysteine methyltransferase
MSFDTISPSGMRTLMGTKPGKLITIADQNSLLAYGANCGKGLLGIEKLVTELKNGDPNAAIITKMNSGLPAMICMQEVYPGTPQIMADYALKMYDMGVRIIGACCGSTPKHLEAMAKALQRVSSIT